LARKLAAQYAPFISIGVSGGPAGSRRQNVRERWIIQLDVTERIFETICARTMI
jgi:hypothetical protein